MSRTLRRTTAALALAPLLAGVAGCGAGLDAQTYQERTAADAMNTAVGFLDVRNVRVQPPLVGRDFPAGSNAVVQLTIVSSDDRPDRLLEASSPVAEQVVPVVDGAAGTIIVPPLGSTGNAARLQLNGLTQRLVSGETVPLSLRFERAGAIDLLMPVGLTGQSDRPVFTGGQEGEPALQGPAGGHGEKVVEVDPGTAGGPEVAPAPSE